MKSLLLSVLITLVCVVSTIAQESAPAPTEYVELRAATSGRGVSYGFAEYTKRFGKNKDLVWDNVLIHTPGQDELFTGFGLDFKVKSEAKHIDLTLTPTVYGIVARSNNEKGIAIGITVAGQVKKLNVSAFIGHFQPITGSTPHYTFGDSVDATTPVSTHWEAGASFGFFCQNGSCNPLIGPLVKRNDKRGSWSVLFRTGYEKEFQMRRTFNF